MDKMKKAIADRVRDLVSDHNWSQDWRLDGSVSIEIERLDDLNTVIKVGTPSGQRHFNVRLSETV